MNISIKNLELLISEYLLNENGIVRDKTHYAGEILIHIRKINDYCFCDIHFKYFSGNASGIDIDIVEFSLSNIIEQTKENLTKLQNEVYINKNCLYNIIEILKDL